ncbi:transglycosylase SLT domain-containing protein [Marinobacterium aestuariivivens]|uniref:Transglycosylase SLT domain-containing protein n=1 Tax=Marinobacterium aestuariivivens TaxID=1698799 RepID=A0ABW2A9C1_9GAMM
MRTLAAVATSVVSAYSFGFDVTGTQFEKAADKYGIDPVLLYSVALAESASGRGDNTISPWPWTLRSSEGPLYAPTKEAAAVKLQDIIAKNGERSSIDIGFLQINLFWNGHRVEDPLDLLDPEKNLDTGAAILRETINSSPNDLELGIGRYHNWAEEHRSRTYGRRVLSIYQQLLNLSPENTNAAKFDN